MAIKNRIKAIPLSTFSSGSVTGSYQAINGSGLEFPCFTILILNDSDEDITVSYDGSTDHDFVLAANDTTISAPVLPNTLGLVPQFAKGLKVYIKGTTGSGNIYLSGYYVER